MLRKYESLFVFACFIGIFLIPCASAAIIFQENFEESDWNNWKCNDTDANAVVLGHGFSGQHCSRTAIDNFGAITKMGPGHNSNNAYYYWIKPHLIYNGTAGAGTGTLRTAADCNACPGSAATGACYELHDANANFGSESPENTRILMPVIAPAKPALTRSSNVACVVDSHTLFVYDTGSRLAPGDSYQVWYPPNSYRGSLNLMNLGSLIHTNDIYVRYYLKIPPTWNKNSIPYIKFVRFTTDIGDLGIFGISSPNPPYTAQTGDWKCVGTSHSVGLVSDISDNQWHCVENHVKLSDPGQSNGAWELWIDGMRDAGSRTNVNTTPMDSTHYFNMLYDGFVGIGNYGNSEWMMANWTPIAFDDVVVSTSYIGPLNASPDTSPPSRSSGQPIGTLAAGTKNTTMSLVTDESASCRFSNVSGVNFSLMRGNFTTTGALVHSVPLLGLHNNASYHYYIRCNDSNGNANLDDFNIAFSVSQNYSPADTNQDGCIELLELLSYISRWKASSHDVSLYDVIDAIRLWRRGCP